MANLSDIEEILSGVLNSLNSQIELNKLGLAGTKRILDRTRKGIDVDGRPFKPYSDRWAEVREENELPTHVVDLTFSDIEGMLRKVDHTVSNDLKSVAIDIEDPEKRLIASYHDELGAGGLERVRHHPRLLRLRDVEAPPIEQMD